jgi:hypothetical protein
VIYHFIAFLRKPLLAAQHGQALAVYIRLLNELIHSAVIV